MARKRSNNEKGSVLMEYAILQLLVCLPLLALFFGAFYNYENGFVGGQENFSAYDRQFVGFGRDFVEYFQSLTNAISLPIP